MVLLRSVLYFVFLVIKIVYIDVNVILLTVWNFVLNISNARKSVFAVSVQKKKIQIDLLSGGGGGGGGGGSLPI